MFLTKRSGEVIFHPLLKDPHSSLTFMDVEGIDEDFVRRGDASICDAMRDIIKSSWDVSPENIKVKRSFGGWVTQKF